MDTLVLDRTYRPVAIVSWQRAVTLLFEGKIEVIETYEDWTVRSVTLELKVPSIVRFMRAIRGKKRGIKFSRQNVYARDKGRCQYCGVPVSRMEATYDHVVPRAQGGQTVWENIVIACVGCNQKKGGRRPAEAGMRLLSTPVKPTSLPDTFRLTLAWQTGMPQSWVSWLRSVAYWNGELQT